jgi:Holliday junction resolvasome RuvABC endonuclease subunit
MECYDRALVCVEWPITQVKAELTGNGKADKKDMVRVAKKVGLRPMVHDEADAFAVWLLMSRSYTPQFQPGWDKLIYGARNSLL